jgi:hypothetical protein
MNKKPFQRVQPDTLEAEFDYWAKMPTWTESEAAALLCGLNPWFAENEWRTLPPSQEAEYEGLLELARTALHCGGVGWPPRPARWLAWAKKYEIHVPPELEAAVAKYDQQPVLLPKLADRPVQATDAEIDSWICEQDLAAGRRVGKSALWNLARNWPEIGRCTKEKLEERAKLAPRNYPAKVGRPKKKLAEEIGRKI